MKKRFYMLLFVAFMAGSVNFALKSQLKSQVTQKDSDTIDRVVNWFSDLWSRAGSYVDKEDKIIEARLKKSEALINGYEVDGKSDTSDTVDPVKNKLNSHEDQKEASADSTQLSLRNEMAVTLLRANELNKQGLMDDSTYGYLTVMLEGLRENNFDSGEDNLISSVNANLNNTLEAQQEGALDQEAVKTFIEDTYSWWYQEYNVADQHKAGGLSPDPVDEALFGDDDDLENLGEEADWDDDDEDEEKYDTPPVDEKPAAKKPMSMSDEIAMKAEARRKRMEHSK